ncbi:MICAL-like protein 2 [Chionoecetes opilio]|uniref:MICAL-like protein 2 n=1 Tax=Chionoecetes opilio TaxID=41210 RepID=A0A8J5CSD9_CHIOP|nr:MICAL-like protein 2 [Chionoecetes opilio]
MVSAVLCCTVLCCAVLLVECFHGSADHDEVLSWKMQKDLKNHSNKINGTPQGPPKPSRSHHIAQTPADGGVVRRSSLSKSEAGEWKRKKGPAPLRPVPQKRALKKLPMKVIQQELQDIDIKQTELERQGVLLETSIRKRTRPPIPPAPWRNSPPRPRPPTTASSKREKRLEEEHVELEYQIRCLMLKLPEERSGQDTQQEEELIERLVKVVQQRDEIINCLELDRLREAQEDESIATHMMQYQARVILATLTFVVRTGRVAVEEEAAGLEEEEAGPLVGGAGAQS